MRALSRALRIILAAVALALSLAADWRIPDRYIPWTPLDMAAPLDAFSRGKILRAEGHACRMILARGGVVVSEVPERDLGGLCSQRDAVRLTGGGFRFFATGRTTVSGAVFCARFVAARAGFSV